MLRSQTSNRLTITIDEFPTVVATGFVAGLVAALLDVRQAGRALEGMTSLLALSLQAVVWNALFGVLLAIVAAIALRAGVVLGRRVRLPKRDHSAVGLALFALPGAYFVAARLFDGGMTSRLWGRPLLIVLVGTVLTASVFFAARLFITLLRSFDSSERKNLYTVLLAAALVALTLAARWCDAHLYRRLYLYLHGVLAVVTIGGLVVAARLLLSNGVVRAWHRRTVWPTLVLLPILLLVAHNSFGQRQQVRFAAFERTATLANVLRAIYRGGDLPGDQAVDPAILERRARRRQLLAEAAGGDLPIFPDAHVVLISVDALRADRMGAYGNTARDLTPRIDAWARQKAVVFERPYCPAPHSSYAITSIHTGHPTRDEALLGAQLRHPTVADLLADEGYWTRAFYTGGIFHTEGENVAHYQANKFGFRKVTHGAPPAEELTRKAKLVVDRIAARQEPAFLWLHYFNVHEPYRSTRFGSAPTDRYDGEIWEADRGIGELLDHIDATLGDNVIVVLTADHGEEFKDHGGYYHGSSLYDEQTRVPLIIKIPGGHAGRVANQVSTLSIAPTVLGLVGAPVPTGVRSADLRAALVGGDDALVNVPIFGSVMQQKMVVEWPWKLIADFGRGYFELFDLAADPRERVNRYDDAQVEAVSARLLGEIYGWLDELSTEENPAETALNLGRMRDPRAGEQLVELALNRQAGVDHRVAALELLAGVKETDVDVAMSSLLSDPEPSVAMHAALTLGEHGDGRGFDLMFEALFDEQPAVRDRAALTLARLGHSEAVPGLIEAMGRSHQATREQAVRYLGRLGDPAATEHLLDALGEERLRYLVVLALGKIADPRAFAPLMDVLENDTHTDVRGYTVVGLGWYGNPEATPRLLQVLREEPEIKWTPEALVRLGAVGRAPLFGTDATENVPGLVSGFGRCTEKPRIVHGDFLGRTTCQTTGRRAVVEFPIHIDGPSELILRARHTGPKKDATAQLTVRLAGRELGSIPLRAEHDEHRLRLPAGTWPADTARVELSLRGSSAPSFELDHFLVLALR